jgi:uncharacterized OB-fold protein
MSAPDPVPYGDPLTTPFWRAAERRELSVQRCLGCGHHQFPPRPHCVRCGGVELEWRRAGGEGTIYSLTVVRFPVAPELPPPYAVALVELDEGPRLLANLDGPPGPIGARVRVAWREREGLPPLPVFQVV